LGEADALNNAPYPNEKVEVHNGIAGKGNIATGIGDRVGRSRPQICKQANDNAVTLVQCKTEVFAKTRLRIQKIPR
jgi:hypothetical protein